jgi:uncharacterized protein YutD
LIRIQAGTYELVEENRDGWNPEAFRERYSDVLDKYDYIVGDWGYGQLRLRGFYDNNNRKVPFEQKIASLDEYLQEFCNFGCAYFVLRRVKPAVGSDPIQPHENQTGLTSQEASEQKEQFERPVQNYERPERPERAHRHMRHQNERQERQERTDRERGTGGRTDRSERFAGRRNDQKERQDDRYDKSAKNERFLERRGGSGANGRFNRDKVSHRPQRSDT